MNRFFILTKKEIKELITPQLVIPLVVMVMVFAGIGGVISDETEKGAASRPLYLADRDNSALSQGSIAYLEGKNYDVQILPGEAEQALEKVRQDRGSGLVLIPRGYASAVESFERPEVITYRLADNFSLSALRSQSHIDSAITDLNTYIQGEWIGLEESRVSRQAFSAPVEKVEYTVVGGKSAEAPFMAVAAFIRQQTTFVPIILFLVIVVASQMVATAVASEKESKTLETLLSLPIGRKSIVFAKLLAAGLVSFVFAGFYMYGFSRYMGGIAGSMPGAGQMEAALGPALAALGLNFGLSDYLLLGASLFLAILAALSIALMLGLLADNIKSVQLVVTPLMLLILVPYLLTMFIDLEQAAWGIKILIYAIPFSYPFLAMQKLLVGGYSTVLFGLVYQLAFFLAAVFFTTRIFGTDRILTMRLGRKSKKNITK